jgi:hypothetical protein
MTTTTIESKAVKTRGKKSGKANLKIKREIKPAIALTPPPARGLTPEAADAGSSGVAVQAIVLPQDTGKIKLDTSTLRPQPMLTLLTTVGTGMANTVPYASLPVLADVQGARTALSTIILNIQNLEIQLREARVTESQWMGACGSVLQRAAIACENEDSDPATLLNAGWTLRKGRSPAQVMPAPAGLRLKQTTFAGQGFARWGSVANARYYEARVDPVPGAPLTLPESVLLTSTRVQVDLPEVAPGSLVTICVRVVGAKGAGPFCDALTARVN